MTVKQLITALERMPQQADVLGLYGGTAGLAVEHVWLARAGFVMLAAAESVVYHNEDRPLTAPTREEKPFWYSPQLQKGE